MNNRVQKPRSVTESGQFPRIDPEMLASRESPEKPAPSTRDAAGVTGLLPVLKLKHEGEDAAKGRDDSASGKSPAATR
jgi:hypothetical protein